jgi:hypothetical protein
MSITGGSYILDAKTGDFVLVERTLDPAEAVVPAVEVAPVEEPSKAKKTTTPASE